MHARMKLQSHCSGSVKPAREELQGCLCQSWCHHLSRCWSKCACHQIHSLCHKFCRLEFQSWSRAAETSAHRFDLPVQMSAFDGNRSVSWEPSSRYKSNSAHPTSHQDSNTVQVFS